MLSACIGQAVYSGPLGRHQLTVLQIIITILHHLRTDSVLAKVHLCNCCCEFSLCQWATHAWDAPQHDRETRNVTSAGIQSPLL